MCSGNCFKHQEAYDNAPFTDSFKIKAKAAGQAAAEYIKEVEIAEPLEYLSNF